MFTFVILPIILGTIQYGYHYWSLETGAAAAREAARRLAVGTDPECTLEEATDRVSIPALAKNGTSGASSVVITFDPPSGRPTSVGGLVKVTVSFQSLDLGLLPLSGGGVVTETAEARVQAIHADSLTDPSLKCE